MPYNVFYSHVQLHGVPVIRIQKVFRCVSCAVFYVQVRLHSVPLKETGILMRDLIVLRFIRRHGVLLKQIDILMYDILMYDLYGGSHAGASPWCSLKETYVLLSFCPVLYITSNYIAMVSSASVLRCTSRYIAMVFP